MTDLPRDLAHVVGRVATTAWLGCRDQRRSGTTSLTSLRPTDEAWRLLRRLEFHYVPKHASWLNMVEIEIGKAWTNASTATSASFPSLMK
jgi:hypothetical protein